MEEDVKMVGIIHIYSLFNKKEFKEGTAEINCTPCQGHFELV